MHRIRNPAYSFCCTEGSNPSYSAKIKPQVFCLGFFGASRQLRGHSREVPGCACRICCSILFVKILKVLAVCLLILALPVQGFAAASQAFCHGRQAEAVLQTGPEVHVHKHEQASNHPHHGIHAESKTSKPGHKCSNCSQCCAGYAMTFSEQADLALVTTKSVLIESLPVLHGSVSLSSLERPPRFPPV